jgi:hypothetical protein
MMLTLFVALSLIYITIHALVTINRMSRETCGTIRATYILIAIGAVSGICELIDGHLPNFSDAILIGGLVLYFVANKRRETCQGVK